MLSLKFQLFEYIFFLEYTHWSWWKNFVTLFICVCMCVVYNFPLFIISSFIVLFLTLLFSLLITMVLNQEPYLVL